MAIFILLGNFAVFRLFHSQIIVRILTLSSKTGKLPSKVRIAVQTSWLSYKGVGSQVFRCGAIFSIELFKDIGLGLSRALIFSIGRYVKVGCQNELRQMGCYNCGGGGKITPPLSEHFLTLMFLLYISPSLSVFLFKPDSSFFGESVRALQFERTFQGERSIDVQYYTLCMYVIKVD